MGLFNVSEPYSAITRALAYTIQDCSCCYIHKEIRKYECILNVKQKLICLGRITMDYVQVFSSRLKSDSNNRKLVIPTVDPCKHICKTVQLAT
jgi:hypothetical protein